MAGIWDSESKVPEKRAKELLKGAVDFHIHTGPDIYPRLVNDIEVARQAKEAGMKAVLIKSHATITADRAQMAQQNIDHNFAEAFNNGMEFFSTFGGNPVSCAIGLEVLDVVRDEGLQEHALKVGSRMMEGLLPFVGKYPLVGDVRGTGLFLGVELVRNRETLEPAADEASFVVNRLRDHGILLGTDGPYHNVVKIRPPMPFDESNADFLVGIFENILKEDL